MSSNAKRLKVRLLNEKKKKAKQDVFGSLSKFPNCIGRFPDNGCKESTKEKPSKECLTCPYYEV